MKVNYECASCMLRQSREAIENAVNDTDKRMDVTLKTLGFLERNFKNGVCSNKLGTDLHHEIMKETGNYDPYKKLREKGTQIALDLVSETKKYLDKSPTLENYVKIAIAGNIIDFGALGQDADIKKMLKKQLAKNLVINDIDKLDEALKNADKILYLADNGGEIVFDKLLITKIKEDYDVEIILALKESPILNDALVSDAKDLDLDEYATLISTGANSVGVVEEYISDELKHLMDSVDFIISKGMGNYEGLTEMKLSRDVYYLLSTKCTAISRELDVGLGSSILMKK